MELEIVLETIYHVSGVLIALFLVFIAILLKKEKAELMKSRIFLSYERFKIAFYLAAIGAAFFAIGNVSGLYNHPTLQWLHEITEVIYNLFLVAFVILLYSIVKPRQASSKF